MTKLHATPHNIDATGFYFSNVSEYETKATMHTDRFGNMVEEFEIQFIDGEDAELFAVCGINQANLAIWFDAIEFLQDYEKASLYYLVGVVGYSLDQALSKLDEPIIYQGDLLDAATELFDECYLHTLPDNLKYYIDYEKFACDCELGGDMCEFKYAGTIYTCTNPNAL